MAGRRARRSSPRAADDVCSAATLEANAKTNQNAPLKDLYARLRGIGLPRPYVQKYLLPEWWDDAAAETPAGFTEALWTIARHLGVDADQLTRTDVDFAWPRSRVQFKHTANVARADLELARVLAEQVARFALRGVKASTSPMRDSASDLRAEILDRGHANVSFEALLDLCWSRGIPVLHVANFPRSAAKMMALAVNLDDRLAIVTTQQESHPAWHLFVLGHELGHIALGHVDTNSSVVDEQIDERSDDEQERAANAFAMELLTGSPTTRVTPGDRWPNATGLASKALQLSAQHHIDAGHLVLNYAHSMPGNFYPVAREALKLLPAPDARSTIRQRLAANLDWSAMPDEAAQFVARMTGMENERQS